ncbi:MAG: cytochrome c biogenesis protein CcsA [Bacteroidota bacterium]|nr:cytochrome c biogenesis protein CcsA [Bacteroidota bacterium]
MIGTIGKLLILLSLVAVALSGITFLRSSQLDDRVREWKRIGRLSWWVMTVGTLGAFGLLIFLNVTHAFEYAYVYENTAMDLSMDYLVAASWAGQEGSFLLWIVMNSLVGLAVIRFAREYEAPVMAVIALCQLFLISMIAGLQIGPLSIGSSPFATLAEKFPTAPMIQAGIIPTDGQGLNDLLRNYWMVIHPPVLFAGFASMIVPFAFAVTALWKRRYTEWVRPALPWTLFAVMSLGVGIALGGYWAYITLNFGGYWAWDPVENSSLVPWLIGIAAIHTMIVQKRSGHSHKAALFLAITAYILVVYSTFLTRSGILGDISVHSFVDLGLYNQLLLWILTMGLLGFGLFFIRMGELPKPDKEPNMLSREFMIFAGAMILTGIALVVLLGTSAPIIGRIFRDSPSTVPIDFYNKWSLPLTIVFLFLAGLGQLFWWNKMTVESVNKVLFRPVVLSSISTIAFFFLTPFRIRAAEAAAFAQTGADALQSAGMASLAQSWAQHGPYLLMLVLIFVAFFAFWGNAEVMWRIARGNLKLAGGAATHIGFAIVVLGIVTSSGLNNPIGRNGAQLGASRDNFVISRGETRVIQGYTVTYTGQGIDEKGLPTYILAFEDPNGRPFEMQPVAYESNRGQWIQNPDLKIWADKDLFVAVSPSAMFGTTQERGQITLSRGESASLGGGAYSLDFVEFDLNVDHEMISDSAEVAVGANLLLTQTESGEQRELKPVYIIKGDRSVEYLQNSIPEWGISVAFTGMNVDSGSINLGIEGVEMPPEDWLVVQAYEKPFISLVWIGFIILSLGFCLSVYRRAVDQHAATLRRRKEDVAA